jgi:hypothetical protein
LARLGASETGTRTDGEARPFPAIHKTDAGLRMPSTIGNAHICGVPTYRCERVSAGLALRGDGVSRDRNSHRPLGDRHAGLPM